VPVRLTNLVAGVAGAATLKFSVPIFGPPEIGVIVTDTMQALLPAVAGKVAGRVVAAKPAPEVAPVIFTLVIVSGAPLVLVLVIVTVCAIVLTPIVEVNERRPAGATVYDGSNRWPMSETVTAVPPAPPKLIDIVAVEVGVVVVGV
jgi:hypothetical protein